MSAVSADIDVAPHALTAASPTPPLTKPSAELPVNNYTALMNAVNQIGPLAISAAAEPWQTYDQGVCECL